MSIDLMDFVSILGRAEQAFDGRENAVEWMEKRCENLGGFRPIEMLTLGDEYDAARVSEELRRIDSHYAAHGHE